MTPLYFLYFDMPLSLGVAGDISLLLYQYFYNKKVCPEHLS